MSSSLLVNSSMSRLLRSLGQPLSRRTLMLNDSSHITAAAAAAAIQYYPIYSVSKRDDYKQPRINFSSVRSLANTTQGTFAPSKFASAAEGRQSARLELATNHAAPASASPTSVFDEPQSQHLPPLPVPSLSETLERLKETIWPIAMNPTEFASALKLIERFSRSAGPKLELLLKAKAHQTKNWLTHDWWQQETYLKSRAPLVVNSNPAMIYPELPFEVTNQRQLISTIAQLISGLIQFKLALQAGYNPEATSASGEFQLDSDICYSQYKHIFGTLRVPGQQMDSLTYANANETTCSDEQMSPFKFMLSFQNQLYEIQLAQEANKDGQKRLDTLIMLLNKLFDSSLDKTSASEVGAGGPPSLGAGVLTTGARAGWARNWSRLINSQAKSALEESQFLVCLDSIPASEPSGPEQLLLTAKKRQAFKAKELSFIDQLNESPLGSPEHYEALSRQVLHADRTNVGNRWFDKSLQLIIVSDQANERYLGAGINYEHSMAEGGVVAKMIEYSYDRLLANQRHTQLNKSQKNEQHAAVAQTQSVASMVDSGSLNLLSMFVDDDSDADDEMLQESLRQAQRDYLAHVEQFDLAYFEFRPYGANAIKSWRFSPDSWFQVALQLAHYKLHKRLGPCYESASTRSFAFGRTETIRSLTKDVAEFCQQPQYGTLREAIQSHKRYANAANNASAIDRVLMGYRLVFNELKSGAWSWGVPEALVRAKSSNKNLQQQQQQQQAAKSSATQLNDLFDERELEIVAAFLNNELIERSKKFSLSTSQVSSNHAQICMSYGPILDDGYGCCYNITGQQMVGAITANSVNSSFSCEVHKFRESLHEALEQMRALVEDQMRTQNKRADN